VWAEIVRLLEDPSLIQNELDRRLAAARTADPARQRENVLQRDVARTRKSIDRLLTAYQEELLSLDELRRRMPELRQREHAQQTELQAILDQVNDRAVYLRLAETLSAFLAKLRGAAGTLDIQERQRILRLIVREILIEDESIIIRHSIPVSQPPNDNDLKKLPPSRSGAPEDKSYLLRSGRRLATAGQHLPALRLRPVGETMAATPCPWGHHHGAYTRRDGCFTHISGHSRRGEFQLKRKSRSDRVRVMLTTSSSASSTRPTLSGFGRICGRVWRTSP
jgi:site-specific DNA recombinase